MSLSPRRQPTLLRLSRSALLAVRTLMLLSALLVSAAPAPAQVSYTSMPLDAGFGPLDPSRPSLPVQQIIQEFTAKEALFKEALDNYTYTRSVLVQTLDEDNKPDGQYYQVTDITFDPEGHRMEHVTDAPETTLTRVMMSPADFSDIEERLPFVLTTQDAPQYDITYVGKQQIDDVETWVFDVKPKVIEKKHRYFQGRIWVDQRDHQIVVTNGKNVPDDLRQGHEDLSIPFVTYRQQIDGKYWFPVYTHGDGVLHFSAGRGYLSQDVHMRETVKYTNYHQFRTSIRIIYQGQDITNQSSPQKSSPAGGQSGPAQPGSGPH